MTRILMRSVHEAFEYVMDHYHPFGLEAEAARKDTYAILSIQDTHMDGFGFTFCKNKYCRDVLTLYFDDIDAPVEGLTLFTSRQADEVIDFLARNRSVDTLLIHCYAGVSRSGAVADFVLEYLGSKSRVSHSFNTYVRNTLEAAWQSRKNEG